MNKKRHIFSRGGIATRESGNSVFPGMKSHNLVVLGHQFRFGQNWHVVCQCDCGLIFECRVQHIFNGAVRSCGCRKARIAAARCSARATHGERHTKLYSIWRGVMRRCYDTSAESYKSYGARGIRVCDEWHSYAGFSLWARSNGYCVGLSIDRFPNRSGDYSPFNCRWATEKEQARNRDCTVVVEFQGESLPLTEWCDILNIPYNRTKSRLRSGWSVDAAFTEPNKRPRK